MPIRDDVGGPWQPADDSSWRDALRVANWPGYAQRAGSAGRNALSNIAHSMSPVSAEDEHGQDANIHWQVPPMISGLYDAGSRLHDNFTLPDGRMGIPNPQNHQNQEDVNAALMTMFGGNAFNPLAHMPEGAVGMFAGRTAKTADHAALARAEELHASGAPRDQIWNDTGWFKGGDQQWRHEISDHTSAVSNQAWAEGNPMLLQSALRHDDLFKAYPDLKTGVGQFEFNPDMTGGFTDDWHFRTSAPSIDTAKSIGLHETQHMIQSREGFHGGRTSVGDVNDAARAAGHFDIMNEVPDIPMHYELPWYDRMRTNPGTQNAKAADWRKTVLSPMRDTLLADAHRRAASEVEARNVQTRMDMTAQQRRETPPWLTEDVSPSEQYFHPDIASPVPFSGQNKVLDQISRQKYRDAEMRVSQGEAPAKVAADTGWTYDPQAFSWKFDPNDLGELFSDTGKPSLMGSAVAGAEHNALPVSRVAQDGTETWFSQTDNGVIVGRLDPDVNSVRILSSTLHPGVERGRGHGTELYRHLIDAAHKDGTGVISDSTVSALAQNVYGALERRGYSVERNPRSELSDAGIMHNPGVPVSNEGVYFIRPPGYDGPALFSGGSHLPNALSQNHSQDLTTEDILKLYGL